MKSRVTLLINGLCGLSLAWLYLGDALDSLHARTAEVSAYLEPPNLGFAVAVLLATAVGTGATVLGMVQRRQNNWRGYRLMPIVTVVVLFIDLFLFKASQSPLNASDRTSLTLQTFAEAASAAASVTAVPQNSAELQAMVEQFGSPAYRVNGAPAKAWSVAVRQGCSGPVNARKDEPLGTLFYCVSVDLKAAWISAVTLPVGTYFGAPQLFTQHGELVFSTVNARIPEEPDQE